MQYNVMNEIEDIFKSELQGPGINIRQGQHKYEVKVCAVNVSCWGGLIFDYEYT